jgi:general L-amino acid transport system substrate-binding protein
MIKSIKTWILVGFASLLLVACGQGGDSGSKKSKTLENTKKAGFVKCGVSEGVPGFSNADASGNWSN